MYIIEVAPIAKTLPEDSLSYFHKDDLPLGTLVKIPLRKRLVHGIVTSSTPVERLKSELRNATFEMKKVSSVSSHRFFSDPFMKAIHRTASYFAVRTGTALTPFVHSEILDEVSGLSHTGTSIKKPTTSDDDEIIAEKYVIQTEDEERFAHYKSLIREAFAKKTSVFFCLPTTQDIVASVSKLNKGIEDYTCVVHGGLTKKATVEMYTKILKTEHPILIIATGSYLSIPRNDIGLIIVERENSRTYKTQSRPFLDYRTFAEFLTEEMGAKLVLGDIFLQTETMFRLKSGEMHELYPLKFRSLTTSQEKIVDMRTYKTNEKHFTLLSDEVLELARSTKENHEHMYLYTARKGLAPTTVCGDCGSIVQCSTCHSPARLHTSPKGNFFLCHTCGERRPSEERCVTCDGWRLVTLGIGTERIVEELQEKLPDAKLFLFDKHNVPTPKGAKALIAKFYSTPGSILVGTEMALPYLDKPIQNTAIASIDALFSIPDFRVAERVLSILLKIRSLSQKGMILQTRNPDQHVLQCAMAGNIVDFYREETAARKQFNYPPFSILIKISIEGDKDSIVAHMSQLKTLLGSYEVDVFPSFVKGLRGKSVLHALVRIPRKEWPDQKLVDILSNLPPQWIVKVDPDTLL